MNRVYSDNEEYWHGYSLSEVIQNGDLKAEDTVWTGIAEDFDTTSLIDASDIIDLLSERAYDNLGECAEDFPNVSKEAVKELNDFLKDWISRNDNAPYYHVKNVEEIILTQADIDEAFS